MIERILITNVVITKRHREPKRVESLAESINHVGQLNAIIVRDDMQLIAGGRRLAACRLLGLTEILANVLSVSDIDAELMEIDENLERHELTVLQRGEQMARRKELYEARHPTTKAGGDRKSETVKSNRNAFPLKSFAVDTADKTGMTPRTVRQEVQIAQDIDDDVKDSIRGTELEDRKVDLLELSRLPKEDQKAVVDEVIKNKKTTVAKVKKERGLGKPKRSKSKPKTESSNGPVGKSKVNDEIVDDPPDVAEHRRQGKIAPDVVPEITESGDGATIDSVTEEIDEEKAMTDDALSDEDWLAKLPLWSKLEGVPLKTLRDDALSYRSLEKARDTFKWHVSRAFEKVRRKGPYVHRLKSFMAVEHPKKWLICPKVEDGGCGGSGSSPISGNCQKCYGAGYWIKH